MFSVLTHRVRKSKIYIKTSRGTRTVLQCYLINKLTLFDRCSPRQQEPNFKYFPFTNEYRDIAQRITLPTAAQLVGMTENNSACQCHTRRVPVYLYNWLQKINILNRNILLFQLTKHELCLYDKCIPDYCINHKTDLAQCGMRIK